MARLFKEATGTTGFHHQFETFCGMNEEFGAAFREYQEKAKDNPRLGNYDKGPPGENYVYDGCYHTDYLNIHPRTHPQLVWRPMVPTIPYLWLDFVSFAVPKAIRLPNVDEKLMCDYVLLSVIHDQELRNSTTDTLIFLDRPYEGKCFRRDEFSKDLWWAYCSEKDELKRNQKKAKIERALEHVKTDLAKKPAGKGQNNTLAKRGMFKRITVWIFKKTWHLIVAIIVAIIGSFIAAILIRYFW